MARASTAAGGHGGTSPASGVLSTGAAYNLRQPAPKRKGIQAVLTGRGLGRGRDAAGLAASSGGEDGAVFVDGSQACSFGLPGPADRRARSLR